MEAALGMSYAGKHSLCCMKHVDLNVAADCFMNAAMSGVNGGMIIVSAELAGTRVAVALLRQTRWLRVAVNFWNVKNPQRTPHIQVKHQFVSSPRYRVYVSGGVKAHLHGHLERGSFIYTPFLGGAYALAQIDYISSCDPRP